MASNDLRILFQHSDIEPHKDVEHFSTRNRDVFLDEYIQPLQLNKLSDAEKLVGFIEQAIELPCEPNSVNPEARGLLTSLQQGGWRVVGTKISLDIPKQTSTYQDGSLTMPNDVEKLIEVSIKGLPRAMYPLRHRRKGMPFLLWEKTFARK